MGTIASPAALNPLPLDPQALARLAASVAPAPVFAPPGPAPVARNIPGIPPSPDASGPLRAPGIASPRPMAAPALLSPPGTPAQAAPQIASPAALGQSPMSLAIQKSKDAESAIKPPNYTGKLGILQKIGDAAGRLFMPGLEQRLGVGTLGYQDRLAQAEGQTDRLEKQAATEAGTQKAAADSDLEEANARKDAQETPEKQAWNAAVASGKDPLEAFQAVQAAKAGAARTPEDRLWSVLSDPQTTPEQRAEALATYKQFKEAARPPRPMEHIALSGPDGKPVLGNYDPATGQTTGPDGRLISNPQPFQAPKAGSAYEDLKKEHPGWTVEQLQQAMQAPTFPRIEPVNDVQGNTIGYNYLEGQRGGGVVMKFVPAGAGGAPTVNGVIPPKPTAGTLGMQQMAKMTETQIPLLQGEVAQLANKLGPAVGRWNDYMVGKVGTNDPEFAGLKEDLKLFASAVVRTHFGARGGEQYINALENDFRAAQSPEDLQARIAHAGGWIEGYANGAGLSANTGEASPNTGGDAAPVERHGSDGKTYVLSADRKSWGVKQ